MTKTAKLIRMPSELADRIQELAGRDNRTFTAQVVQILEEYVRLRDLHPLYWSDTPGVPPNIDDYIKDDKDA